MKRKKKKTKRIGRGDSVDSLIMGGEPSWKDIKTLSEDEIETRILKALNWYNYSCESTTYKPWTISWMSTNGYSKKDIAHAIACDVNALEFIQVGGRCRIINLGGKVNENTIDMIKRKVVDIISIGKQRPKSIVVGTEKVNIQERIQNKTKEYAAVLEARIDDLFILAQEEKLKTVDHGGWLGLQGIKHVHFKKLSKNLDPYILELKHAHKGDPDLKEAFSFLGKRKIKTLITSLEDFREILNG